MRTAETQLDTCRQVAPKISLAVVEEFVDHDVSGMVPFGSRAAARRLLGVIEERSIDAILVYRADRLARSPEDLVEIAELFDRHGSSFGRSLITSSRLGSPRAISQRSQRSPHQNDRRSLVG